MARALETTIQILWKNFIIFYVEFDKSQSTLYTVFPYHIPDDSI